MGRGTRTNIYSGRLLVRGGGENDEDDEFNNNSNDRKGIQVVLKILDQSDKDIDIVSLVIFNSSGSLCIFTCIIILTPHVYSSLVSRRDFWKLPAS